MLGYAAHQLELGGRHYLPLPKMNSAQMDMLSSRLGGLGYAVQKGRILRASSPGGSVHVDPLGLCWSSHDPADEILPMVPSLAASPKAGLSLEDLGGLYFGVPRNRGRGALRLFSRLETGSSWDKLRALGGCGLTPDEHFIARHFIEGLGVPCRFVTDFPVDGSIPKRFATKAYFLSKLDPSEASSTLRVMGTKGERNSYIPRDGILGYGMGTRTFGLVSPSLFTELGDWCSFRPSE